MSLQQNDNNNDSKHIQQQQQSNEHVTVENEVKKAVDQSISQQQQPSSSNSSAVASTAQPQQQQQDYTVNSLFSYADNPIARRFSHLNRSIEEYEKIDLVGEGTYGKVFKAQNKRTGEFVAVKKVKIDKEKDEDFPITSIREISILKLLQRPQNQHENIVKILDIVTSKDKSDFFMIFEYIEHDLAGLIEAKVDLSEANIKSIIKQLLEALFHCHSYHILHRDLKTANLLISQSGVLKLADFGLSRFVQPGLQSDCTNRVITRWYRPPELFLGATEYGPAIDIWSVGCILGELLAQAPILPGKSEAEQLGTIFELCGAPTLENWPDVDKLKNYSKLNLSKEYKRCIKEKFHKHPPLAVDLLEKLLTLDPKQRPTASACLDHPWFWEAPAAKPPDRLPSFSCNEHKMKEKRIKKHSQQQQQQQQQQKAPQQHGQQHGHHHHSHHSHHQQPPPHQQSSHHHHHHSSHHGQHHGNGRQAPDHHHHHHSRHGSSSSHPPPYQQHHNNNHHHQSSSGNGHHGGHYQGNGYHSASNSAPPSRPFQQSSGAPPSSASSQPRHPYQRDSRNGGSSGSNHSSGTKHQREYDALQPHASAKRWRADSPSNNGPASVPPSQPRATPFQATSSSKVPFSSAPPAKK